MSAPWLAGSLPPFALRVTADDAGFARSSDDAILHCHHFGIVQATSCTAGGPTALEFLSRAPQTLRIGWHLNLTEGYALASGPSTLTDHTGRFCRDKRALWEAAERGAIADRDFEREIIAQAAFWQRAPRRFEHIDGHNHVHLIAPVRRHLRTLYPETPRRGAPVLCLHGDHLLPHEGCVDQAHASARGRPVLGLSFALRPSLDVFLAEVQAFRAARPTCTAAEFMVHPGRRRAGPFSEDPRRDLEVQVLTDPRLRAALTGFRVQLD